VFVMRECPVCLGTGVIQGDCLVVECPVCLGTGEVV